MKKGYHILEIANVHGGDFSYFKKLIQGISEYKSPDFGVKLQIFKSDLISLPDFSFYHVYEELFFDFSEWEEIIDLTSATKDVWIDVFDLYGVQALEKFSNKVYGIKFQASVLDNIEVFEALSTLDLTNKYLMINVSGLTIEEIKTKITVISNLVDCKEILLQIGYQSYPTPIEKSGLGKLDWLKDEFDNRIIYADHTAGDDEDTYLVPILAMYAGAYGIEKHIMLGDEETKYDFQASITLEQLSKYMQQYNKYCKGLDLSFINDKEVEYLEKTIQKPVTNVGLKAGKVPSLEDFYFRRTDFDGLSLDEIKKYQEEGFILRNTIPKNSTIRKEDFRKPNVAAIVACRLKSSRLKNKALLKIGDLTSIEMCLKNTMRIKEVNHVVLATSNLESDADLVNYTYHDSVIFHTGDAEDVIRRYLDVCDQLHVDTVIRITGDCPYISHEIASYLYESHLKSGADYTATNEVSVGTSAEIIEVSALRKIKSYFESADYSEYMTWYFINNPDHFKINKIDLPKSM